VEDGGALHTHGEVKIFGTVSVELLFNVMQKLLKSVKICQSYWQKFIATFFMSTVYTQMYEKRGVTMASEDLEKEM